MPLGAPRKHLPDRPSTVPSRISGESALVLPGAATNRDSPTYPSFLTCSAKRISRWSGGGAEDVHVHPALLSERPGCFTKEPTWV